MFSFAFVNICVCLVWFWFFVLILIFVLFSLVFRVLVCFSLFVCFFDFSFVFHFHFGFILFLVLCFWWCSSCIYSRFSGCLVMDLLFSALILPMRTLWSFGVGVRCHFFEKFWLFLLFLGTFISFLISLNPLYFSC